jgi:23S rRNA pseudouridine1911/1915/1917 synthase
MTDKDTIEILYEDNHLIAINKKPGDLAQSDASEEDPLQDTIMAFLKERDKKPGNVYLGTLHRLDKPVSGVVVFAKTSKAAARMSEIIRSREALKVYIAVTEKGSFGKDNQPERFSDALVREGDRTFTKAGKPDAFLDIITLPSSERKIQAIRLISGKKHQIRAQLTSRGCPIIGDRRYGSKISLPEDAIALHCLCMGFIHPVKKEPVHIVAPLPEYMECGSLDAEKIISMFEENNKA